MNFAPDVNTYYENRSNLYRHFVNFGLLSQHKKCGGLAEPRAKSICLAEEAYLADSEWLNKRPVSFVSRMHLADSGLNLAFLKNDADLAAEATRLYRETAEMVPTSFKAWNRLADVNIVLGQPQEALHALEKALALLEGHSESLETLVLQAKAYEKLGQTQQELDSLEKAISISPRNPELYFIRGSTFRILGQYEEAIEDLNQAIDLDLNYTRAYHSRALAFANLGKDEEAYNDLERAVELGFDRNTLTAAIEELQKSR